MKLEDLTAVLITNDVFQIIDYDTMATIGSFDDASLSSTIDADKRKWKVLAVNTDKKRIVIANR